MKKIFFVIWTSLMLGFVQSVAQNTLYDSVWEKAKNGDARSQSIMGDRYYWGQKETETQKDYKKAAEWYLLAANQGYCHAQYMLGWMFEYGQGVEKDMSSAFKWYSNGASQNDPGALKCLGEIYFRGKLYSKDYVLAFKYLQMAAELGDAHAQYMVGWMYQYGYGTYINKVKAKEWYTKSAAQNNSGAKKQLKLLEDVVIHKVEDDLASITWLSSTKSLERKYNIRAGIKSKTSIKAVSISVNGEVFRGINAVKNDGYDMMLNQEVQLNPGENIVEISIKNSTGTKLASKTISCDVKMNINTSVQIGNRVALIIGNSAYKGQELKNPTNDANDLAQKLTTLGFKVVKVLNANMEQMEKSITSFGGMAKGSDVALFYFAGHGVQVEGMNYMIPIDATLESEEQTKYRCTNMNYVLTVLEKAQSKMNIVILDACRNNPFERSWHRGIGDKGLSVLNAPYGTLLAYATNPGNVAMDGVGRNSPYAEALLNALSYSGLKIYDVFQKISERVSLKTNDKQHPWFSASLSHSDFYFNLPK